MLTTKEAADILGVSTRRVTALISVGSLKAERLGRSWAVDEASVKSRAAEERLRGRPAASRTDPSNRRRNVLMSRNHEVLSFTYNLRTGETSGLESHDGIAWKPFGIGRREKLPNRYDLAEWLRNRAIPAVRPHLSAVLREFTAPTPTALMLDSWGLSLTDPYWFKPEGTEASWEEIDYRNHDYDEAFGEFVIGESDAALASNISTRSPDASTNGMLIKAWTRRDGTDYLIKGGTGNENREPYNEKLATRLLSRLLEDGEFVKYEVVDHHGRAYSSCASFVGGDAELIPAQDVLTAFAVTEGRDLHRGYLNALAELDVPQRQRLIDKMIVADYLMANFDRHTHNFGLIRNPETLDGYRIAPLFDHGCGFYCHATTDELESRPYAWESHPFREYPSQQLALVEDLSWYDPSALEGFMDDIAAVLSENPAVNERFIAAVQRQTARQIDAVNSLAAERGLIVAGW